MQWIQVSKQERNVYCSFICSHAVRHTRKLLRSLGKHWHETHCDWHVKMSAVWRACRHMWACISVCMCLNAFSVYPACVLFLPVCLRACVFIVHWAPKVTCQDTDVRKLRRSESDKQTVPGGGSKHCAAIALLLSVCPRCHVTEVFSTIKAFSMVQHCVCVCVLALAEAPPMTGYIGHAQTKPNTQQEPQAIRSCHSA